MGAVDRWMGKGGSGGRDWDYRSGTGADYGRVGGLQERNKSGILVDYRYGKWVWKIGGR